MQILQTTETDLSPIDAKDLKSRHVLTDLLNEQIDLNEELSGENQLLAFQQRKLIQLLTQKDNQISKYRNQVNAPDLAGKTNAARNIQFTLFSHLIGRITSRNLASAFEILKSSSRAPTAAGRFESLVEKLCQATKARLVKFIILSASNFRNQQEIKSFKLLTVLNKLISKQYTLGFNGVQKHIAIYESSQNVKLSGALLLSSLLHGQLYSRVMNSAFSKIKESSWNSSDSKSIAAERICNLLNGAKNRYEREFILNLRMKPYQEAAFQVMKVTITSKKFLGLQFLNFLLQKFKNRVAFQAFLKIKATHMGSAGKLEKLHHILDKHASVSTDQLQLSFLKLRLHSNIQQLHLMHIQNKAQKLSMKLEEVFKRSLKVAFHDLVGEKENIFPNIVLTRKKRDEGEKTEKKNRSLFVGKENWPSNRNKIQKIHSAPNRKMTFKGAYKILQNRYIESNRQHSIQLTNCMGMMGAKLMNFQQLNEQIIRESRETIQRTQELEEKLEAKKKREKELTEKLEELMDETKHSVESKSQLSIELNQALNQLSHAKEKIKGYEKKCARLIQTNDKLENDKNSLVEKAEELMETLQTIQAEYHKNKQDLREALSNNQLLNDNLQDKNREVSRLKEKYAEIEDEFKQIKKLSEKKLSSSQGEKLSGEVKELRNQINKLKKEKNEISDKYEEILSHNNRLKSTNAELTKEVITINEEKNSLKAQMSNIKDTTANSKREVAVVEMKLQKALQELEEKKSQLMQKMANERTTPEYINQILDEKKSVENENRALKQRLDKMTNIINTYDKNAIKQTDELLSYQKETEMLRDHRLTAKNEIKDLNESLANLNRDKVNLMREMTLINDRNVKLEKEADAYRKLIEELQNEIQNYQLQMDVYVQVLKSMEDKMNRLENKSKLTMSVLSNNSTYGAPTANYQTQGSTQRDTLDLDEDELMNRLKTIKNKIETAHP